MYLIVLLSSLSLADKVTDKLAACPENLPFCELPEAYKST